MKINYITHGSGNIPFIHGFVVGYEATGIFWNGICVCFYFHREHVGNVGLVPYCCLTLPVGAL